MGTIEAILSRRSIRKYTARKISLKKIEGLLKAAMAAPSAFNAQPWHFIIIDDRRILDKVPEFHHHSDMLLQAKTAIAVCGDTQVQPDRWMLDCSAAVQNILLTAHAEGLGAVWVGIYPVPERIKGLKDMLGLPDHIVPLALIPLGYPREKKSPANRYDPSKIHNNHW